MAATATIYEDELPDPAGELFDALRTIEFDAAAREQQALIAGGLAGDEAKARYLALKERMAELKKPRVIE
jgi:DNA primase